MSGCSTAAAVTASVRIGILNCRLRRLAAYVGKMHRVVSGSRAIAGRANIPMSLALDNTHR